MISFPNEIYLADNIISECNQKIGPSPAVELNYSDGKAIDSNIWRESIYANFPSVEQLPSQKLHFHIGIQTNCDKCELLLGICSNGLINPEQFVNKVL